jgi:hypothetical protein
MFGTAFDYYEVNAGIHRKSARILTAPAVVWYLAFWTNAGQRDIEGSEEGAAEVKHKLDNFILTLCRVLDGKVGAVKLAPCISGVHLLFNKVCHEGSLSPARIDLLSIRQKDVFTSTSRVVSLQFTWKKLDVTIRFEIHTEYFSLSTFVEFDKTGVGPYSDLDSLNRNIGAMLGYFEERSTRSFEQNLTEQLNTYFFYDFWKAYEGEILSHAALRDLIKEGAFNRVFADFRGLILSDQVVNLFEDAEFTDGDRRSRWGQNAKRKLLPLIQPGGGRLRNECAANYMLDGHAFYLGTVGPQLVSTTMDERNPGEFIVYASQRPDSSKTFVNKWQLGRLVNQILLLDTLRLCALKDVKPLHEAGRQFARLDLSTQEAGDATLLFDVGAMDLIRKTHQNLSGITGEFLRNTGSGLLYRIERSRYYVQQFEENLRQLRITRLEGDQPYDQFIKRRLGSEFDFIDRLGIRYARAAGDLVTLGQKVALLQNQLAITQNKIQSSIYTIQEWGEFALLAALVPYYVVHLLEKIVPEKYIAAITIVLWSASAAFAFWRKTKKVRYSIFLLIVGTMLFFTHTFLSQHFLFGKLEKSLKEPNSSSDNQRNHSGESPDISVNSLGAKKDRGAPPAAAPPSAE